MRSSTPLEISLDTDAISEFEHLNGKPYRENTDEENMVMMGFYLQHIEDQRRLLELANDTTIGMSVEAYTQNITEFGFNEIYLESFTGVSGGKEMDGSLKVFWHPSGLLLHFDTYYGVNSGKVHYNWRPFSRNARFISSGSYTKSGVWVGNHNCLIALRTNMRGLMENGELLSVWEQRPHSFWITHWGEKDLYENHDWTKPHPAYARTNDRIAKFPESVQAAISGRGSVA